MLVPFPPADVAPLGPVPGAECEDRPCRRVSSFPHAPPELIVTGSSFPIRASVGHQSGPGSDDSRRHKPSSAPTPLVLAPRCSPSSNARLTCRFAALREPPVPAACSRLPEASRLPPPFTPHPWTPTHAPPGYGSHERRRPVNHRTRKSGRRLHLVHSTVPCSARRPLPPAVLTHIKAASGNYPTASFDSRVEARLSRG